MLRALAGLIKVIKVINVIKKLDKCLGGNMFSAEAKKKKRKSNGSGLTECSDRVSQLREQQEG